MQPFSTEVLYSGDTRIAVGGGYGYRWENHAGIDYRFLYYGADYTLNFDGIGLEVWFHWRNHSNSMAGIVNGNSFGVHPPMYYPFNWDAFFWGSHFYTGDLSNGDAPHTFTLRNHDWNFILEHRMAAVHAFVIRRALELPTPVLVTDGSSVSIDNISDFIPVHGCAIGCPSLGDDACLPGDLVRWPTHTCIGNNINHDFGPLEFSYNNGATWHVYDTNTGITGVAQGLDLIVRFGGSAEFYPSSPSSPATVPGTFPSAPQPAAPIFAERALGVAEISNFSTFDAATYGSLQFRLNGEGAWAIYDDATGIIVPAPGNYFIEVRFAGRVGYFAAGPAISSNTAFITAPDGRPIPAGVIETLGVGSPLDPRITQSRPFWFDSGAGAHLMNYANDYIDFTFTGTGVSMRVHWFTFSHYQGTTGTMQIGDITVPFTVTGAYNASHNMPIAEITGLPYGEHTVRITNTGGGVLTVWILFVHGPITPDAPELANNGGTVFIENYPTDFADGIADFGLLQFYVSPIENLVEGQFTPGGWQLYTDAGFPGVAGQFVYVRFGGNTDWRYSFPSVATVIPFARLENDTQPTTPIIARRAPGVLRITNFDTYAADISQFGPLEFRLNNEGDWIVYDHIAGITVPGGNYYFIVVRHAGNDEFSPGLPSDDSNVVYVDIPRPRPHHEFEGVVNTDPRIRWTGTWHDSNPDLGPGGLRTLTLAGQYSELTFTGTGVTVWMHWLNGGYGIEFAAQINNEPPVHFIHNAYTHPQFLGLPYGEHTIRVTRISGGGGSPAVNQFILFEPILPATPEPVYDNGYITIANIADYATTFGSVQFYVGAHGNHHFIALDDANWQNYTGSFPGAPGQFVYLRFGGNATWRYSYASAPATTSAANNIQAITPIIAERTPGILYITNFADYAADIAEFDPLQFRLNNTGDWIYYDHGSGIPIREAGSFFIVVRHGGNLAWAPSLASENSNTVQIAEPDTRIRPLQLKRYVFNTDSRVFWSGGHHDTNPDLGPGGLKGLLYAGQYFELTFTGTGVDVWMHWISSSYNIPFSVQINNEAPVHFVHNGSNHPDFHGLPYGQHTIRVTRTGGGGGMLGVARFVLIEPRVPATPAFALDSNVIRIENYSAAFAANVTDFGTLQFFVSPNGNLTLQQLHSVAWQDYTAAGIPENSAGFIYLRFAGNANWLASYANTPTAIRQQNNTQAITPVIDRRGPGILTITNIADYAADIARFGPLQFRLNDEGDWIDYNSGAGITVPGAGIHTIVVRHAGNNSYMPGLASDVSNPVTIDSYDLRLMPYSMSRVMGRNTGGVLAGLPATGVSYLTDYVHPLTSWGDLWNGASLYSTAPGTGNIYFEMPFTGIGFQTVHMAGGGRYPQTNGSFDMFINGVFHGNVDLNATNPDVWYFAVVVDGLPQGDHVLRLVKTGGGGMNIVSITIFEELVMPAPAFEIIGDNVFILDISEYYTSRFGVGHNNYGPLQFSTDGGLTWVGYNPTTGFGTIDEVDGQSIMLRFGGTDSFLPSNPSNARIFDRNLTYRTFDIIFDVDFNAAPGVAPANMRYMERYYITLPSIERSGHVFLGWFLDGGNRDGIRAGGVGDLFTPQLGDGDNPSDYGNVRLIARWEAQIIVGRRIYVSSSLGNDGNSGLTPYAPIQTIEHLNSFVLHPGDTVLFRRGDTWLNQNVLQGGLVHGCNLGYNGSYYWRIRGAGTESSPVRIVAWGPENLPRPVINGSGRHTTLYISSNFYGGVRQGNHIVISDIHLKNNDVSDGIRERNRRGIFISTWEGETISGIHLIDMHVSEIQGAAWHNDVSNVGARPTDCPHCTYEDRYRPMPCHIFFGQWHLSIAIGMNGNAPIHDLRIESIYLFDVGGYGINFALGPSTRNSVFRNNVIRNTGMDSLNANFDMVEFNAFYDNARFWTTFRPNDGTPDWNRFRRQWTCIMYGTDNMVIQFNVFARARYDHDSMAIDWDMGVYGTTVAQFNFSHDNEGGFVMMWPGTPRPYVDAAIVRYNISVNDGNALCIFMYYGNYAHLGYHTQTGTVQAGWEGLFMYNNTFIKNNGYNIGVYANQTLHMYNNIFWVDNLLTPVDGSPYLFNQYIATFFESFDWSQNPPTPAEISLSHNAFWGYNRHGQPAPMHWSAIDLDANLIHADPMFVGPIPLASATPWRTMHTFNPDGSFELSNTLHQLGAPYMLQEASPLRGAGKIITSDLLLAAYPNANVELFYFGKGYDFFGNPIPPNMPPTIGFHELQTVEQHTVTFYNDDVLHYTTTVYSGNMVAPPENPQERPNYTFGGWETESGELWNFDTIITADLRLSARWTSNLGCDACDDAGDVCCIECGFHYENCEVEGCPCPVCQYLAWREAIAEQERLYREYREWREVIEEQERLYREYRAWRDAIEEQERLYREYRAWRDAIAEQERLYREWREWLCATGQCGGCNICD